MMAYRQFHAYKKQQLSVLFKNKTIFTGMTFGTLKTLISLQKKYNPKRIIFLCDGLKCFRYTLFPKYKIHRKPKEDDFLAQLVLTSGVVSMLGIPQIIAENYEADDLIATWAKDRIPETDTKLIVSTDKDLFCLLNSKTHMLLHSPKQRLFTDIDFKERFGILQKHFHIFLALTGDKTDGIMGIQGIGPVTATKLILKYKGDLKSIINTFEKLERQQLLFNIRIITLVSKIKTSEMFQSEQFQDLKPFWAVMNELKFKSMFLEKNKQVLELIHENNKDYKGCE